MSLPSCELRPGGVGVGSSDPYLVIDTPIADTYVDSDRPTTNFGDAHFMRVKSGTYTPLVRFDPEIIAEQLAAGDVLSAQLTLWVQNPTAPSVSCDRVYEAHALTQHWEELGANFGCANQTAAGCAPSDVWSFDFAAAAQPYHPEATDVVGCTVFPDGTTRLVFDVTPDLQSATSDGVLHGWAIVALTYDAHLATVETSTTESGRPAQLDIRIGPSSYVPADPTPPPLNRTEPTSVFDATRFLYDPCVARRILRQV